MAREVATLVADATPYLTAAVSAYGGAVLAKARDDAADATVGVGRRLPQRVFGRQKETEPLPELLASAPGATSVRRGERRVRYGSTP
jgi:hypothetical protein